MRTKVKLVSAAAVACVIAIVLCIPNPTKKEKQEAVLQEDTVGQNTFVTVHPKETSYITENGLDVYDHNKLIWVVERNDMKNLRAALIASESSFSLDLDLTDEDYSKAHDEIFGCTTEDTAYLLVKPKDGILSVKVSINNDYSVVLKEVFVGG